MKEIPGSLQTGPESDHNRDDDPLRERHGDTPQPDSASDMGVGTDEDDDEFEEDEDVDDDDAESDVDES
jgi:hypothetical protein